MLALTGIERSYASAIGQTMHNLTVQAEVGSVMEGMLGDLEAWEWANKEEVLKKELEHARAQVQALKDSERTLLEREKLASARLEEERATARDVRGKFVEELWGLAREFRIREQEQAKADQLGKKLARLEGVETDLREAESKLIKMQSAHEAAVLAAAAAAAGIPGSGGGSGTSAEQPGSPDSIGSLGTARQPHGSEALPEGEGGGEQATLPPPLPPPAPAVKPCLLLDLEKKPLLKVFVFLNAGEVLRAAQVCRPMFRKVDLMFGIGSQAVSAEPTPPAAPPAPSAAAGIVTGGGAPAGARDRAGSAASASSASTGAPGNRLGQRALASALGVVASRVEAVTAGASSGFGSLAGAAATLTGAGDGGSGPGGGGGGGGGGMSPELMDDLSKRLTTVEMKGIIQLTERGRRMEARAGALQAEKEDLFARLQGTESVKEFLVAKLKDTEAALKRSLDEKGLTLRQSASDQEVISFLDSRTQQEMERVAQETMDKAMTYQTELENQKASGQKQTKVLEDMLRFEKQRGEAGEAAFKAQKKLLVTEVKKLRTTNLALKAECDDLRQQLKDLRTSVSQLGR
ncbi:unnamed protein product [Ectocarpus sp. 12 AP-2014]